MISHSKTKEPHSVPLIQVYPGWIFNSHLKVYPGGNGIFTGTHLPGRLIEGRWNRRSGEVHLMPGVGCYRAAHQSEAELGAVQGDIRG